VSNPQEWSASFLRKIESCIASPCRASGKGDANSSYSFQGSAQSTVLDSICVSDKVPRGVIEEEPKTRTQAREVVIELALEDLSKVKIERSLQELELDGLLDPSELESIVLEVQAARRVIPHRPGTVLPRCIGLIAVIMGGAGIWIGAAGPSLSRFNPAGCGIIATMMGAILIFKPSSGKSEM
jgi:hypothetical protein